MCIHVQDIKFLWSNLWTGGLSTDDDDDNANDDANDDTWWTIHDCIGSSAISKWAKYCPGQVSTRTLPVTLLNKQNIWHQSCTFNTASFVYHYLTSWAESLLVITEQISTFKLWVYKVHWHLLLIGFHLPGKVVRYLMYPSNVTFDFWPNLAIP